MKIKKFFEDAYLDFFEAVIYRRAKIHFDTDIEAGIFYDNLDKESKLDSALIGSRVFIFGSAYRVYNFIRKNKLKKATEDGITYYRQTIAP